jgi:ATP-dependent DNA ligase
VVYCAAKLSKVAARCGIAGLGFRSVRRYSKRMPTPLRTSGFIDPCIPTRAYKVPAGPDWVHEIKHDGYLLQVRREGETVCLFTRRGYDWSGRYPAIAVTATLLRARSFTLDGEAWCAVPTVSPSSMLCTGAVLSARPCCTPSPSWSSTAKIFADYP